jgi:hypothetical protein
MLYQKRKGEKLCLIAIKRPVPHPITENHPILNVQDFLPHAQLVIMDFGSERKPPKDSNKELGKMLPE